MEKGKWQKFNWNTKAQLRTTEKWESVSQEKAQKVISLLLKGAIGFEAELVRSIPRKRRIQMSQEPGILKEY